MRNVSEYSKAVIVAVLTIALSGAGVALAAEDCAQAGDPTKGTMVEFELETGERLKGVYGGCQGVAVMINHSLLGLLVIPRSDIDALAAGALPAAVPAVAPAVAPVSSEADGAAVAAATAADAEALTADAGEAIGETEDGAEEAEESPWTIKADAGLNGSQGNSNDFNGTAGTDVTWEKADGRRQLVSSLDYMLDMNGQHIDDQTAQLRSRHDWLFPDSPWRWFVGTDWFYSEDENWDVRGLLNVGPAYDIITNEKTELFGFTGLGVSREFGGDDDDYHPEWLIGYDWKQKLTDHWDLSWVSIYYQKLDDGEFRFDTELNFEYKFVEDSDVALRFGIKEKYNSDPDDGDSHDDFTYFLSLAYTL